MPPLVLVAYNNTEILAQIEIALRGAGYRVMTVASCMDARDILDRQHPAALVTGVDFGERKPNGVALARMARFKRPRLPVLFLCTAAWEDLMREYGEIVKLPLDPAELVARVGRMTGGPAPL